MRKQTKLVAVLSATALLAIGASATAFAAGWDNSTGEWQWLDNDGIAVTDTWKKSGDNWFYLGDDGNMLRDSKVDDGNKIYYVNADGVRITNAWVAIANEDTDYSAEYFWYYFGSDGKAYKNTDTLTLNKLKTINGKKYAFDSEGRMLYGWVAADQNQINEDDTAWATSDFYFGDWNDGSLRTGWQELDVIDTDGDGQTYWFWFGSNGKKVSGATKKINGKSYIFKADGSMDTDWVASPSTPAQPSAVTYLNGDGAVRKKTWVWAVPDKEYLPSDYNDDNAYWWYFDASGKLYADQISKINGRRYAFDDMGRMLTGLVTADQVADSPEYTNVAKAADRDKSASTFMRQGLSKVFMFAGTDDGSMKYGYQNYEFADDSYQLYFNPTNGQGTTGYISKIKKFTASAVVLKANLDMSNYAAVAATVDENADQLYTLNDTTLSYGAGTEGKVLINSAGTIMKSKTNLKDANGYYFCTDKNGKITYAEYDVKYTPNN